VRSMASVIRSASTTRVTRIRRNQHSGPHRHRSVSRPFLIRPWQGTHFFQSKWLAAKNEVQISPTSQSARTTRVPTSVTVQHLSRSQARSAPNHQLNDRFQSPDYIKNPPQEASNGSSDTVTAPHHTLTITDLDQPSNLSRQGLHSSLLSKDSNSSSIRILASPANLDSIHPSVLSRRSSKIGHKSELTRQTNLDELDSVADKEEKHRYRFRRRCCASLCPCCSPCCCLLTGLLAALLLALLATLIALLISAKTTSNARRYDSLDPRLNVLKSLFSMRFIALSH
jgi:hypothetical protein